MSTPIDVPKTASTRMPNNAANCHQVDSEYEYTSFAETAYLSATDQWIHPRSFKDTIESFTSSCSRASMLYIAENLPVPSNYDHNGAHCDSRNIPDEERALLADQSDSRLQEMQQAHKFTFYSDSGLDRTLSAQTTPIAVSTLSTYCEPLSKRATIASVISQELLPRASINHSDSIHHQKELQQKSSFLQSVFNAINILIGVGILAFPLAFRISGWLIGSLIFVFCAAGTNYTAKLLARCLDAAPGATTYGDMGMAAFGERGRAFIGSVFFVELFAMAVAMVALLGDGLQALFPSVDFVSSRLYCFFLMAPFLFFPLRKLSVASFIGIVSCVSLVIIVLFDGFSKNDKPGSLWDPMETEIVPSDPSRIPLSFGLMMAGFAGHAVFPSIYRDMQDPKMYDRMVDITYVITFLVYVAMAAAGYLMFGTTTMQEITQNLAVTPGFYKILNYVALWLVVVTPIAKYALIMNPVNVTWELWLKSWSMFSDCMPLSNPLKHGAFVAVNRLALTCFVIYVATVFPAFDRIVSLLGALFSFGISAIFPLLCYQRLYGQSISVLQSTLNILMLAVALSMAVLGTVWSFLPLDEP